MSQRVESIQATHPGSFDVERSLAASSRRYHEAAWESFSFADRRRDLARFAETYYRSRLRVPLTDESRAAIDAIADPETVLIEMAHDGQLPHLGIVRMVLKAHDVATAERRAVTIYTIGNHYTATMRRENLRFGMPVKGVSPDQVKRPPKVPVPKPHMHTPFRWLPPPSARDLEALRRHILEFVRYNLAYERKRGARLPRDVRERLVMRLQDLFEILTVAARDVGDFGDWLIRVQYDLFHLLIGPEAGRIVFLPMAELSLLVGAELETIAQHEDTLAAVKASVSADQVARGETPYQRSAQVSCFWIHCPECHRRTRKPFRPGSRIVFECPSCKRRSVLEGESAWQWVMPDIVALEAALLRLGIDGWVVGSHAPYIPAIERTYARLFGMEMPPKFFLTSVPVFRGIGDPPGGYGRTRLLRALLEMEPASIASALRAPWDQDPRLRSDLMVGE